MNRSGKLYRLPEIKRFITFSIIGLINTFVDFGIYMLMTRILGFHYGISQVISYSCGVINSFLLNGMLTFGDVRRRNTDSVRFARFLAVNLLSMCTTLLFLHLFNDILRLSLTVSKMAVTAISQAINYTGYKVWVFR